MKSIPRLDSEIKKLEIIKGLVPNLLDLPSGCPFHPRCDFCFELCTKKMPELINIGKNHLVRCHLMGGNK